ncbi:MAG: DUF4920 domain-containing protein [Saprospiraceae bacterium]|nr:DUF4920 domain-containing protein [Saprospiraceae bacterium]
MKFSNKALISIYCLTMMVTLIHAQEDQFQSFGDQITVESAVSVTDLLAVLTRQDSVVAKVSGQINNVCQMKGCWMNISDVTATEPVFVQFKDYAFFVPKDAAGKEVVIEGVAYRELTTVEDLRHYAKDAGQSEDEIAKITEPKEEIRFMAKGVLIKVSNCRQQQVIHMR